MAGEYVYYVYIHVDPQTGNPFYVGKGSGNRAWKFNASSRSKEWREKYLSSGVDVVIFDDSLSENDAILIEGQLIMQMREDGEILVNKSTGGQCGATGVERSIYTKEKIRAANGGRDIYCSNGMKFFSSKEAARWVSSETGDKCNGSGITQCCKGQKVTAYGYAWSYYGVPDMPEVHGRDLLNKNMVETLGVKIVTSSGISFPSIRGAVRYMRSNGFPTVGQTSIRRAIDNPGKVCCGVTWRLNDE